MKKVILLFAAICLCALAACSAEKPTQALKTEQPAPSETQTTDGGNTETAAPAAEADAQTPEAAEPDAEADAQVAETAEPITEENAEVSETAEPISETETDEAYDVTQPIGESDLVLPNGVRLGMSYEEVEAICGTLEKEEFKHIYQDAEHIRYFFRVCDDGSLKLNCVIYQSQVVNDELVYTTSPEAAAFRDIHLGDSIDEVFDKLPCVDRELKRWATQYVYGSEDADEYAVLSLIADSYYSLFFYVDGVQRANIAFSRVQQCVFDIQIYSDDYWEA